MEDNVVYFKDKLNKDLNEVSSSKELFFNFIKFMSLVLKDIKFKDDCEYFAKEFLYMSSKLLNEFINEEINKFDVVYS